MSVPAKLLYTHHFMQIENLLELQPCYIKDRSQCGFYREVPLYYYLWIKDNLYIKDSFQAPNVSSIEGFHCTITSELRTTSI